MELDVRTIYMLYAVLYLMLHGLIWFSLAPYRNRWVTLWCTAGITSAVGIAFLACEGLLAPWVVAVFGQIPMALGNLVRQYVLRSIDAPVSRGWIVGNTLFHLGYLLLNGVLFMLGASYVTMMLVFFGFYALNCTEFFLSGQAIARVRGPQGARSIQAGGAVYCISLSIKFVALMAGWGAQEFYAPGWDQVVFFLSQILALSFLNFGFMQIQVNQFRQQQMDAELALAQQRQRVAEAQLESLNLAELLREREEIIRQLTLSNKSAGMGALVASFAHELNQPLAATLLHAELIQSQLKAVLENGRSMDPQLLNMAATHIVGDTQRAGDIIRKLRNLFRMGKGEFSKLDFKQLVLDVLDILKVKTAHKNVRILVSFDERFFLSGDATQLHQVVLNLVSNALDAMSDISHRERILQIRGWVLSGYLVLEVEDNGTGIAQGKQSDVFSLFKSTKSDGMGVGLWLSQSIVESHAGSLSFVSQPGQGTVFTLRLPSADYVLVA